jgi:DNA-binding transcriptional ArsR family regulator
MSKRKLAEKHELKIAEELKSKGVNKKKEIANKYRCDIGQIMTIAKKYGIDSNSKEETKETQPGLTDLEKVALAKELLEERGDIQAAARNTKLDKDLCIKAAEGFYHPKYANLPEEIKFETQKFRVLVSLMVLNIKKREDLYEILKDGHLPICKILLKGITPSHVAASLFSLKEDGIVEQDYLPGVKKSPTIRISQMTLEQLSMVAEAVDNKMATSDIADMLGCSTSMVYSVFHNKAYHNAKKRYDKNKMKSEETHEPIERYANEPVASDEVSDLPLTLEALNKNYRSLEIDYNAKLEEAQKIKNNMDEIKKMIDKLQEKEEILKKVEELEHQKKMLMEQLQTL